MAFPAALPHGPIIRVVDGVHAVRGSFQMGPGMRIGRTMTIVEHDGGLMVLNAIRLSAEGEAEIERLGKVTHLIKLSDSHGVDEPYYVDRFRPRVWASKESKPGPISATEQLGPECPLPGGVVVSYPGTSGWNESGLFVANGGGTLITCDALQNHVDREGTSWGGGIMTSLLGFKGGLIVAPMWRKYQKVSGAAVTSAFTPLLEHSFDNLVTGHGPAITGSAGKLARAAVERASQ